ncbi:MAG: hypothetical protein JW808_08880 [Victivallales bacterium]|nr:hypothetical protein [Victivallales bacterium]
MPALYLISGNDSFSIRQKANSTVKLLCGEKFEGNPSLDIINADSHELKLPQMIGELILSIQTPDLFGEHKYIWVKRLDFSLLAKTDAAKAASQKLLAAIKPGLPENMTLIIDGTQIDKRSSLFKTCDKFGEVHIFDRIDTAARKWEDDLKISIMKACQALELRISRDAVEFLAASCSADAGRVATELDKLASFIYPESSISIEHCKQICCSTPEAAGWAFSDAVASKKLPEALEVLNVLYKDKSSAMAMVYSIASRFQEMIHVKSAAKHLQVPRNCDYNKFQGLLNGIRPETKERLEGSVLLKRKPFAVWMLYSQSARFADSGLGRCMTKILEVNKALVSGGGDPRTALELLAAEICSQ